jgi:hypothetical protein
MFTIFSPLRSIITNSNILAVYLYSYVSLYTNIFEMKNLFEKLQRTEIGIGLRKNEPNFANME